MLVAALAVVAVTGCRPRSKPNRVDANDAAVVVSPVVSAEPAREPDPPPAREVTYTYSFFTTAADGTVDECSDISVIVTDPPDSGTEWLTAKGGPFFNAAQFVKKNKCTELQSVCTEQFADRKALASCVLEKNAVSDAGFVGKNRLVSHYYNYGLLSKSDTYMKQCLEIKGIWKAVPRDSSEWLAAKIEHQQRSLRKLMND
jgi:hypothetical protein